MTRAALLLISTLMIVGCGDGAASNKGQVSSGGLTLSISTDHNYFWQGEKIPLSMVITNTADGPVTLWSYGGVRKVGPGLFSGETYTITNSSNIIKYSADSGPRGTVILEYPLSPGERMTRKPSDLPYYLPRDYYELNGTIYPIGSPPAPRPFLEIGKYSIQVENRAVGFRNRPELFSGKLKSNVINIWILPPKRKVINALLVLVGLMWVFFLWHRIRKRVQVWRLKRKPKPPPAQ